MVTRVRSVCVVGAGAAGLCSARHLLTRPQDFAVTVFEQAPSVGGTWAYTDASGHSSMYKNLRTNLPKEVMAYPDFPFPNQEPSFMHHSRVQNYLLNYASHFHVNSIINLNTMVKKVEPIRCQDPFTAWRVITVSAGGKERQHCFDIVIICNGHYSTPRLPEDIYLNDFAGLTMHSHDYRYPDQFENKTVAILGASASGLDIAVEVATRAKTVYLSHKLPTPIQSKLPDNVQEVTNIKSAVNQGFLLQNGDIIVVDALILCTGYEYSFPFLDSKCKIQVTDNVVSDLYKHVVNIHFPSMCFIGIPFIVVPFLIVHYQVVYYIDVVLLNASLLPCKTTMLEERKTELEGRGWPYRYAHKLAEMQWDYIRQLASLSHVTPPPDVLQNIYTHVSKLRKSNLLTYRKTNYTVKDNTLFEVSTKQ